MDIITPYGHLDLQIIRSSRRTVQIRVLPGSKVVLRVPLKIEEDHVLDMVQRKASWIAKASEKLNLRKDFSSFVKSYDGVSFHVFGQVKFFRILFSSRMHPFFEDILDEWKLHLPESFGHERAQKEARRVLMLWADRRLLEHLSGRVFFWSQKMGLRLPVMNVRSERRLLGSCNYRERKLSFNRALIAFPIEIIDYVVIHELCHLVFPDHSLYFWAEVSKWCPDFSEKRRWLKEEAYRYRSP